MFIPGPCMPKPTTPLPALIEPGAPVIWGGVPPASTPPWAPPAAFVLVKKALPAPIPALTGRSHLALGKMAPHGPIIKPPGLIEPP